MKDYIGTKLIKAKPMNRLEYNNYRGWDLPSDEDGSDEGYLVEYVDGGKANHPDHAGYISWSPSDVFVNAYRETEGMTFGQAIEALKINQRVRRTGWNGKGMFLFYNDRSPGLAPFIVINTLTECRPWLASQADVLSEDWEIVEV